MKYAVRKIFVIAVLLFAVAFSVKAQIKFESKTVAVRRYTEDNEWGEWTPKVKFTQTYFIVTKDTITIIDKKGTDRYVVERSEKEESDGVTMLNFALRDSKTNVEAILSLQVPPEGDVKIFFIWPKQFCLCYEVRIMGKEELLIIEKDDDNLFEDGDK